MLMSNNEINNYYKNFYASLIKLQNDNIKKIEEKSRNEVEKEERKNNCYKSSCGGNIMYNHNNSYGCNNVYISGTRSTIPF